MSASNASTALQKPPPISERGKSTLREICPICHDRARVRSSTMVTPTVRDLHIQCMNVDCGATWKSQMQVVYLLSPSAIENPDIDIPMAPAGVPRKTYLPPGEEAPDPRQIPMFET
ncbi:ogr/Delta-like zinc finger family protein [Parasphingorhabdus sp.]|uniref:ogr/Delta-like zinc finger family protein n=1 Tax=Parasphingorhabdus sp. TaxID=2709688 RepID=UPI002F93EDE4